MQTKYLTGTALAKRIREVMAGQEPRMCVAFLGPNWQSELFEGAAPENLRVICDLLMKKTPRAALYAGGAPDNKELRYLPDTEMHAKVYLSATGAIVCSANASASALSSPRRIEDGIFIDPNTTAYSQIEKEFDTRYKQAAQIDAPALMAAPEYVNDSDSRSIIPAGLTLVELLRHHPGSLNGIRFVCTTRTVDQEIRDAVDEQLDREVDDVTVARDKKLRDYFADWDTDEKEWPALFFSVHRGPNGGFYLRKNRHHRFLSDIGGDVFVSQKVPWTTVGAAFGDMPPLASHKKCRDELSVMFSTPEVFNDFSGKIFTGMEFAELLFRAPLR